MKAQPTSVSRVTKLASRPALLLLLLLLAGFSGLAFSGLRAIPFHPDESTQLFMSADFDLLFQDPQAMAWRADQENDLRQRYRELDAPLTKYILGLGRTIAGLPALPVDWNWSANWQENQRAGALPDPGLLLAGRLSVTLLLPFSLVLIFFSGRELGGDAAGLLAVFFLGSSALVLLHGRRAMAEGALLLGVCLVSWGFIKGSRLPWLAGIAMAVAFNAKQSTLALLPVGLLAVYWAPNQVSVGSKFKGLALRLVIFCLPFVLITLALNPLWWSNPKKAIQASLSARSDLLHRQVSDAQAMAPEQVMPGLGQRAAVLIANLYMQPPAFFEVGNYRQQTAAAETDYLANPLDHLFRGFAWGGLFFALTVLGVTLSVIAICKPRPQLPPVGENKIQPGQPRRATAILLLAGIFQAGGLLVAIPLPFQRYVVPLIPFVCLWCAFGLQQSWQIFTRSLNEHGSSKRPDEPRKTFTG